MKKVFVTKYCLTSSIFEIEAEIKESLSYKKGFYVYGKTPGAIYSTGFFNDDFHMTKEDALKDAESKRLRKIESLKKQIAKLEKKEFSVK